MPLSPKQQKIISDGAAACQMCQTLAGMLRRIGYEDEAAEQRYQASATSYAAVPDVIAEFNAQTKGMKSSDT